MIYSELISMFLFTRTKESPEHLREETRLVQECRRLLKFLSGAIAYWTVVTTTHVDEGHMFQAEVSSRVGGGMATEQLMMSAVLYRYKELHKGSRARDYRRTVC